MYTSQKTPVLSPDTEARLRCLEAAVQAFSVIAASSYKDSTDATVTVLEIADAYESWLYREDDDDTPTP